MNLPPWNPATDKLSVTDTGILVRSPHYQQWRAQVERTFETIDAGVEAQGKLKRSNKLIVAVMPAGVAVAPRLALAQARSRRKVDIAGGAFRRCAAGALPRRRRARAGTRDRAARAHLGI